MDSSKQYQSNEDEREQSTQNDSVRNRSARDNEQTESSRDDDNVSGSSSLVRSQQDLQALQAMITALGYQIPNSTQDVSSSSIYPSQQQQQYSQTDSINSQMAQLREIADNLRRANDTPLATNRMTEAQRNLADKPLNMMATNSIGMQASSTTGEGQGMVPDLLSQIITNIVQGSSTSTGPAQDYNSTAQNLLASFQQHQPQAPQYMPQSMPQSTSNTSQELGTNAIVLLQQLLQQSQSQDYTTNASQVSTGLSGILPPSQLNQASNIAEGTSQPLLPMHPAPSVDPVSNYSAYSMNNAGQQISMNSTGQQQQQQGTTSDYATQQDPPSDLNQLIMNLTQLQQSIQTTLSEQQSNDVSQPVAAVQPSSTYSGNNPSSSSQDNNDLLTMLLQSMNSSSNNYSNEGTLSNNNANNMFTDSAGINNNTTNASHGSSLQALNPVEYNSTTSGALTSDSNVATSSTSTQDLTNVAQPSNALSLSLPMASAVAAGSTTLSTQPVSADSRPSNDNVAKAPPPSVYVRGQYAEFFPEKLYYLLIDVEKNGDEDVICFTPSGTGFVVHNTQEFINRIACHYFRYSTFSSFRRQLYLYNFELTQEGPFRKVYKHPNFIKGRPELLKLIRR